MRKRVFVLASLVVGLSVLGSSAVPATARAEGTATAAEAASAPKAEGAAAPGEDLSEQERDRRAEAIARSIMSPFCPGRTVSACPNAGPWREDIRKWVGEGVSAEDIRKRLAARVPAHNLRGAPMSHYSWVIPLALTVIGIALLIFLMRYLVTPQRADPLDGTGDSPGGGASEGSASEDSDDSEAAEPSDGPPPPGKRSGEDWDARLDQELDSLDD